MTDIDRSSAPRIVVCPHLTDDGFCLRHGDCTCPPVDGEAKP